VVVLQAGRVREAGPAEAVIARPSDAYTRRLLQAAPDLSRHTPVATRALR
jgi:peptide/nickel transport system ATP-binding protein